MHGRTAGTERPWPLVRSRKLVELWPYSDESKKEKKESHGCDLNRCVEMWDGVGNSTFSKK